MLHRDDLEAMHSAEQFINLVLVMAAVGIAGVVLLFL